MITHTAVLTCVWFVSAAVGVTAGQENQRSDPGQSSRKDIRLSPKQVEEMSIRVEPLPAGSARSVIERPATIMFDLDRVAHIGPRVMAKVESVECDLGRTVKVGQTLALMSSVELGRAKAAYHGAIARLDHKRADFDREKLLFQKRIASEASMLEAQAAFHEAEAAADAARETLRILGLSKEEIGRTQKEVEDERPLSYFKLVSSIDGVVQRRDLARGDTVQPYETPIHIVDAAKMWIMVDVYEHDAPLVAPGQLVELRLRSLPSQTFQARLDWVSLALDEKMRTLRVRAIVENPQHALREGMYGTVRIHTADLQSDAALAPLDAVQTVEGKPVLFVRGDQPGSFRAVSVALGRESDDVIEIIEGVSPGTPVVVRGAFELKSALTAESRGDDD